MKRLFGCLLVVVAAGLPGPASAETNFVLKVNVTNPSQKESQTVPVKVYLPKEATPKDVKDVGDLKLEFDPEIGTYFVHGEVTLEAGQSITKAVQIEDIWRLNEEQLAAFVGQARERASKITEPASAREAAAVVERIEQRIETILKRQQETDGHPAERIQAYRQAVAVVATIEQDLTALEKLKQNDAGPHGNKAPDARQADSRLPLLAGSADSPEAGAPLGRSLSMTAAWRIILVILGFLGVLSAVFFLTWHSLLRVTVVREQEAAPLIQGESGG